MTDGSDPEPIVQATWGGRPFGDPLGDNAYDDDGYRFHDVFHLAHAAMLGWSPVCRRDKQFACKRKSDPRVDAVEDGGRAIVTEEAIVAYVYGHARDHRFFEDVQAVDFSILKTIKGLTTGLEARKIRARNGSAPSSRATGSGGRSAITTAASWPVICLPEPSPTARCFRCAGTSCGAGPNRVRKVNSPTPCTSALTTFEHPRRRGLRELCSDLAPHLARGPLCSAIPVGR